MYDARSIFHSVLATPTPAMRRLGSTALGALLIAVSAGCAAPLHAGQSDPRGAPAETPDAVFELWEQDWTLNADGSIVYHDKRHLQLNSDRLYRTYGDPRIAYNADCQQVEVLEARTRLPNGKYVPLADYSTVEVAPDATAGWPAFGGLREIVQVMGGIEPGCVLETEYKIKTKAGARPYLAADLHIDQTYPVRARSVSVTLPRETQLTPVVSGLSEDAYIYTFDQHASGDVTHRWVFAGLPGRLREPQPVPWQRGGVRLSFTTAPDADTWVRTRLAAVDAAANESPLVSRLAREWIEEENSAEEKLGALQKKLAGSFNFLDFRADWRPAKPRNAADVLYSSYGLPAESAAVLLSLARVAGVAAQPALLVDDDVWDEGAAQAAMVAAYVITHPGADGTQIWHPQHGRVRREGRWAGHTLLAVESGKLVRTALPAWTDADDSRCAITGSITIADDGKYAGKLSLKTSGLFVSLDDLETREGQKSRVEAIVEHLLPSAKVTAFTLKSLAPGTFEAEAEIESSDTLEKLHECYELLLAQTSPAFASVPVPLARSERRTPARLVGPFDERIALTIAWPAGWTVDVCPKEVGATEADWGSVGQTVSRTEKDLELTRHARITQRDLAPRAVLALRGPLNELRSPHARTLLLRP